MPFNRALEVGVTCGVSDAQCLLLFFICSLFFLRRGDDDAMYGGMLCEIDLF